MRVTTATPTVSATCVERHEPDRRSISHKAARDCIVFFSVHGALSVLLVSIGPKAQGDIPAVLAGWGGLLEKLIPNVSAWPPLTDFEPSAWTMLVVLWTLMPLSVWWAARGNWVWGTPNLPLFKRRPLALILVVALLICVAIAVAFMTPELRDSGHASRSQRTIARAVSSPVSFGLHAGIALGVVAMCLGTLPSTLRLWRQVRADNEKP